MKNEFKFKKANKTGKQNETMPTSIDNLLDSIDLNKSEQNNEEIMREINLNYLKSSEAYLLLSQKYYNKIERIEKETEKKIYDLDQNLTNEIDKITNDSKKETRTARLKQLAKKTIRIPFTKSYSPSMSPASSSSTLESDNSELFSIIMSSRQKYVKLMMNIYIDCFKEIYKLKIDSIEPLFYKLQNLIDETYQNRIKTLKSINEKEIVLINKSAHEEIKLKKKASSLSFSDKEELQK